MTVKPLNERQLFRMKRKNLEKRINQYYLETQDIEAVLDYSLAVLVFNGITMDNYSSVCKELIKEIFLTSEPSDKLRDYCLYFYDFFEYEEWEAVRKRLFKSRAAFSEHTRGIRPETKFVRAESAPTAKTTESSEDSFETVFKDEQGKKHKQKFKNVDVDMPNKKLFTLLEILTKLPIFEKEGVRRFTEVVPADCKTIIADTF
ncbi:hypothetical protein [Candidatus Enterococcus murrayae]|uniref:Uncharacterized protein n=1 Tax=Candidatus Enterococcus murrayae TaxID=2815321 RepID=A0ABS3HM62_9ENTE|nr:hypothetical protein [Enterococcus sp. MJM16]MBO0454536.1 hypothetical protein [Enterococcus sp. MJM16]